MRALISFVLVAIAVVVQLTIVDRIAFPGGAGPDLVLLMVAALALAGGPMAGVLIGFWAGLALDVAPPGSHFTGQNALVFCLVGYACGLLADDASGDAEQGHTALFEILVVAAGAVFGEALGALLGVMLSDPRVTWPAIKHVLPAAMVYDVLLCPFVLYAAAAALRLAGPREEGRIGWSASQVRARTPAPGANQGAIRQLAGGNSPRLRLSDRDPGSIGSRVGPGAARPVPRREPQLKLGRTGSPTVGLRGATAATGGRTAGSAKLRFGSRPWPGVLGGSLLGGASPGGSARRGSALRGPALRGPALRGSALRGPALRGPALGRSGLGTSRFGSSSMGRSLLGGSVFSRSAPRGPSSPFGHSSWFGRGAAFGRPALLGRSSPLRHRAGLMRPAGGGLAGPRFSRGGSLARLTGALRKPAGPKAPGRGWLRGASSRARSLGGSSLGGRSPGRSLLSRGTFGRGTFGRGRFGRGALSRGAPGRASLSRGGIRRASLSRASLSRASLSRASLSRGSLSRAGLSRRSLSRGWAGSRTPRLTAGRTGRFGIARLRLTRPKAKRTWRTGGYR